MVIIAVLFISLCAFASFVMLLLKWVGVIALPWWQIAAPIWGGYLLLAVMLGISALRYMIVQNSASKHNMRSKK